MNRINTGADQKMKKVEAIIKPFKLDDVKAGQRVFDVKLQGKTIISHLDVAAAAGGENRALTREFRNIAAKGTLTVELVPVGGKPPLICSMESSSITRLNWYHTSWVMSSASALEDTLPRIKRKRRLPYSLMILLILDSLLSAIGTDISVVSF